MLNSRLGLLLESFFFCFVLVICISLLALTFHDCKSLPQTFVLAKFLRFNCYMLNSILTHLEMIKDMANQVMYCGLGTLLQSRLANKCYTML